MTTRTKTALIHLSQTVLSMNKNARKAAKQGTKMIAACGITTQVKRSSCLDDVTCHACRTWAAAQTSASAPKHGRPSKACAAGCGKTIYGRTVSICAPCWKAGHRTAQPVERHLRVVA